MLAGLHRTKKGSRLSRNRLLLRRTVEEAEGYTELGMNEHALRACSVAGHWSTGTVGPVTCWAIRCANWPATRKRCYRCSAVADLLPDDIHVLLALAWCYKRTGQLAKAIEALERAVKVDASEGVLHYNLACYWSLARNRTLALRYLSRALEIDSNFRDLVGDEPDFNPLRHDPDFIAITSVIV